MLADESTVLDINLLAEDNISPALRSAGEGTRTLVGQFGELEARGTASLDAIGARADAVGAQIRASLSGASLSGFTIDPAPFAAWEAEASASLGRVKAMFAAPLDLPAITTPFSAMEAEAEGFRSTVSTIVSEVTADLSRLGEMQIPDPLAAMATEMEGTLSSITEKLGTFELDIQTTVDTLVGILGDLNAPLRSIAGGFTAIGDQASYAVEHLGRIVDLAPGLAKVTGQAGDLDSLATSLGGVGTQGSGAADALQRINDQTSFAAKVSDEAKATNDLAAAQERLNRAGAASRPIDNTVVDRTARDTTTTNTTDTTSTGTRTSVSTGSHGGAISGAAHTLSKMGEGAGVLTGVLDYFGIKDDSKYVQQLQRLRGFAGDSQADVNSYNKWIMQNAVPLGESPTELAQAFYWAVSGGKRGKQAIQAVDYSSMAASADLAAPADVERAVEAATNAYGSKDIKGYADIMSQGVVEGMQSWQDIASSINRASSLGPADKADLPQIIAMEASLTQRGFTSRYASQDIQALERSLMAPSPKQISTAESLGFDPKTYFQNTGQAGLIGTVERIYDTVMNADPTVASMMKSGHLTHKQATTEAKDLFDSNERIRAIAGTAPALAAILTLGSDHFKGLNSNFYGNAKEHIVGTLHAPTAYGGEGVTQHAFGIMSHQNPAFQMQQLDAAAMKLSIDLGSNVVPAFQQAAKDILKATSGLDQAASQHPTATKDILDGGILAGVLGFGANFAKSAAGGLLSLGRGGLALGEGIGNALGFGPEILGAKGMLSGAGGGLFEGLGGLLRGAPRFVAGGLGDLGGLEFLPGILPGGGPNDGTQNTDSVNDWNKRYGDFFSGLGGKAQQMLQTVEPILTKLSSDIGNFFSNLGSNLNQSALAQFPSTLEGWITQGESYLQKLPGDIGQVFSNLGSQINQSALAQFPTTLQGWVNQAESYLQKLPGDIGSLFSNLGTTVKSDLTSLGGDFTSAWSSIESAVKTKLSAMTSDVGSWFSSLGSTVKGDVTSLRGDFTSAWSAIQSAVKSGWNTVTSDTGAFFSSFGSKVTSGLATAKSDVGSFFSSVGSTVKSGWNTITGDTSAFFSGFLAQAKSGLASVTGDVGGFFSGLGSTFRSGWSTITGAIGSFFSSFGSTAKTGLSTVTGDITSFFSGVLSSFGTFTSNFLSAVTSWGSNFLSSVGTALKNVASSITSWFGTELTNWTKAGGTWIGALASGIESDADKLKNALVSAVKAAITAGENLVTSAASNFWNGLTSHIPTFGLGSSSGSISGPNTQGGGGYTNGGNYGGFGSPSANYLSGGDEAMLSSLGVGYSGGTMDTDFPAAGGTPYRLPPGAAYTLVSQGTDPNVGGYEVWKNTKNGGTLMFLHGEPVSGSNPSPFATGTTVQGGTYVGKSGHALTTAYGNNPSFYHLCVVTDNGEMAWLDDSQMASAASGGRQRGGGGPVMAGGYSNIPGAVSAAGVPLLPNASPLTLELASKAQSGQIPVPNFATAQKDMTTWNSSTIPQLYQEIQQLPPTLQTKFLPGLEKIAGDWNKYQQQYLTGVSKENASYSQKVSTLQAKDQEETRHILADANITDTASHEKYIETLTTSYARANENQKHILDDFNIKSDASNQKNLATQSASFIKASQQESDIRTKANQDIARIEASSSSDKKARIAEVKQNETDSLNKLKQTQGDSVTKLAQTLGISNAEAKSMLDESNRHAAAQQQIAVNDLASKLHISTSEAKAMLDENLQHRGAQEDQALKQLEQNHQKALANLKSTLEGHVGSLGAELNKFEAGLKTGTTPDKVWDALVSAVKDNTQQIDKSMALTLLKGQPITTTTLGTPLTAAQRNQNRIAEENGSGPIYTATPGTSTTESIGQQLDAWGEKLEANQVRQDKLNNTLAVATAYGDTFTGNLSDFNSQLNTVSGTLTNEYLAGLMQGKSGNDALLATIVQVNQAQQTAKEVTDGFAGKLSLAEGSLSSIQSAVSTLSGDVLSNWQDAMLKSGSAQNQYTADLIKSAQMQEAFTTATNDQNILVGEITGDYSKLNSGLQGVYSQSTDKLNLFTASIGRTNDGLMQAQPDIQSLATNSIKAADNLSSLGDILSGLQGTQNSLKSTAETQYARTGSIDPATMAAYGQASGAVSGATWDQVGADLQLYKSTGDLVNYQKSLASEVQLQQQKVVDLTAKYGANSTQVQQATQTLQGLETESDGLKKAIDAIQNGTQLSASDFAEANAALSQWQSATDAGTQAAQANFSAISASTTAQQDYNSAVSTGTGDLGQLSNEALSAASSLGGLVTAIGQAITGIKNAVSGKGSGSGSSSSSTSPGSAPHYGGLSGYDAGMGTGAPTTGPASSFSYSGANATNAGGGQWINGSYWLGPNSYSPGQTVNGQVVGPAGSTPASWATTAATPTVGASVGENATFQMVNGHFVQSSTGTGSEPTQVNIVSVNGQPITTTASGTSTLPTSLLGIDESSTSSPKINPVGPQAMGTGDGGGVSALQAMAGSSQQSPASSVASGSSSGGTGTTNAQSYQSQWNAGYNAYVIGQAPIENPYASGTAENNAWQQGWQAAQAACPTIQGTGVSSIAGGASASSILANGGMGPSAAMVGVNDNGTTLSTATGIGSSSAVTGMSDPTIGAWGGYSANMGVFGSQMATINAQGQIVTNTGQIINQPATIHTSGGPTYASKWVDDANGGHLVQQENGWNNGGDTGQPLPAGSYQDSSGVWWVPATGANAGKGFVPASQAGYAPPGGGTYQSPTVITSDPLRDTQPMVGPGGVPVLGANGQPIMMRVAGGMGIPVNDTGSSMVPQATFNAFTSWGLNNGTPGTATDPGQLLAQLSQTQQWNNQALEAQVAPWNTGQQLLKAGLITSDQANGIGIGDNPEFYQGYNTNDFRTAQENNSWVQTFGVDGYQAAQAAYQSWLQQLPTSNQTASTALWQQLGLSNYQTGSGGSIGTTDSNGQPTTLSTGQYLTDLGYPGAVSLGNGAFLTGIGQYLTMQPGGAISNEDMLGLTPNDTAPVGVPYGAYIVGDGSATLRQLTDPNAPGAAGTSYYNPYQSLSVNPPPSSDTWSSYGSYGSSSGNNAQLSQISQQLQQVISNTGSTATSTGTIASTSQTALSLAQYTNLVLSSLKQLWTLEKTSANRQVGPVTDFGNWENGLGALSNAMLAGSGM